MQIVAVKAKTAATMVTVIATVGGCSPLHISRGAWRNGMKNYLKDKRYLRVREKALSRDGYKCQRCKRYGKKIAADTAHHIYPVEYYPQWKFSLWNLISLCSACHNKMHVRETHELTAEGIALQARVSPPQNVDF